MLLTMMDERQFKWQSKKVILCEILLKKVGFHAISFIDLIFFEISVGRNRVVQYLLKKVPKQQTITNLIEIEEPKNIGTYLITQ